MVTLAGARWRSSALLAGLVGVQSLHAAGFALIEQSVPDMGTAYAGAAATADSVDTLYFNPAGMTRLPGTRSGAAVHLVLPQTEFNNEGTTFSPVVGGAPIAGNDGGDAGGLAAVPHGYLTHQLNDQVWLGLAINAPFGLTTEYTSGWVGRYHAIRSAVKTININPSVAFKVNDNVSLAAGVSAMYLDGEFTNAVDFGTLNVIPVIAGGLGGALGAVGPGGADGLSKIEGDSWGWGVNLGALFELSKNTRIGIHYRSEVEQNIEGDVKFTLPTPALAGTFSDAKVKATVDLPATASLSGFHQINDEWAVMADYTWTGWSSIPELRFDFANGLPDGVTTFDWKDTSRVSVGTAFSPSGSDWTYRFGVAYDESPIKDAASRSARLPDADRIWVAAGASFSPSEDLTIDVGYAHLFINEPKINKTGTDAEDVTRGALRGSYDSSVDILSVEARYRFF
ncbi:MAG: outer membrane protein transport protein [Gammaproteobacteria bacterium]|nr:outer membrane protein transport protein [Gammaproteobacteria bacterium]